LVINASNGVAISSGNYTITNNVVYNGALAVKLVPSASAGFRNPADWNISATAQTSEYIDNAGARGIAGLIAVFFALGLAIIVLVPSLRTEIMSAFK
jgi:hypothetical protein